MNLVKVGAEFIGMDLCEFTLWSPSASSVELNLVSPVRAVEQMEQASHGYWRRTLSGIKPGQKYCYVVDGTRRPDPASAFQPDGVHGPSGVVDHGEFSWTDGNWQVQPLENMIFYEIHTGTFTPEGTFEAIIPVLPELMELGITTLELMPVAQFPGCRNWGYDGVYPYAVQNSYGGPGGLKALCDACHGYGLAIFLDVVYNHLGPEGNYLSAFGPYFTGKYRTPWGDAVNFDGEYSDGVRNYFIMNALYWFENFHVDGLRLDAVHGIYDFSAKHILDDLSEYVRSYSSLKGGKHYLVAESDLNDSRVVKGKQLGGYGVDAQWCDDFHHSVHALLTGEKKGYYIDFGEPEHLVKSFTEGYVYTGEYSLFRKRNHGNSTEDIPDGKFVSFIQNHDQVGNRMNGERITALAGIEAHKLAAGTLMLSPCIPLLFMGEEYAETAPFLYFISHGDPDLIEAVRNGRKKEFDLTGWPGDPPDPYSMETFGKSKPDRTLIRNGLNRGMLAYYRELIRIRKNTPAISAPGRKNITIMRFDDERVITALRMHSNSEALGVMNYSNMNTACTIDPGGRIYLKRIDSADELWCGPGQSAPQAIEKTEEIFLKPFNFVIYSPSEPA